MKSILVICFTDLKSDARVVRQIGFLKGEYRVTAACFDAYADDSFELFKIEKTKLDIARKAVASIFLLLRLHRIAYRILHNYQEYIPALRQRGFDLIIANDIEALPFAFEISAGRSKVFFDAHEYSPRQFEDRLYWRIFFQRFTMALCKKYIPRVDGMSTINHGIAIAYEKEFGTKPIVITNASDFVSLSPVTRTQYPIRLVHHGIFNMSRQPHLLIELMELLNDHFSLDLIYLLPDYSSRQTREYFETFKQKALATGRINVLPPLKSSVIIPFIHERYDMGVILVPPVNFNYENGLPNKLFHCIQARMAMAVGPLREIAHIVKTYDIGVISNDFTPKGLADVMNNLTLEELNVFKDNTNRAANEMNAGFNQARMLEAVKKII